MKEKVLDGQFCCTVDIKTKVAGFVDESLGINTNLAILKKKFQNESTNRIFKDQTRKSANPDV